MTVDVFGKTKFLLPQPLHSKQPQHLLSLKFDPKKTTCEIVTRKSMQKNVCVCVILRNDQSLARQQVGSKIQCNSIHEPINSFNRCPPKTKTETKKRFNFF